MVPGVMAGLVLMAAASADPPLKLTVAEAEQRLADCWVEVDIRNAGHTLDEWHHFGYGFGDDAEGRTPCCWLRRGEAVLSGASPIVVEKARSDRSFHVRIASNPGLMQFVGSRLVVVTPGAAGPHGGMITSKAMTRPTDFTSTRANGNVLRVLKRTSGLYGTDPVPDGGRAGK